MAVIRSRNLPLASSPGAARRLRGSAPLPVVAALLPLLLLAACGGGGDQAAPAEQEAALAVGSESVYRVAVARLSSGPLISGSL